MDQHLNLNSGQSNTIANSNTSINLKSESEMVDLYGNGSQLINISDFLTTADLNPTHSNSNTVNNTPNANSSQQNNNILQSPINQSLATAKKCTPFVNYNSRNFATL